MTYDEIAQIELSDGRKVWRIVNVRYRDVDTGQWVAEEEVEALAVGWLGRSAFQWDQSTQQRLHSVQAEIAGDPEAGSKATSAAKFLFHMADKLKQQAEHAAETRPWFVLGRELACELLVFLEAWEAEQAREE
jgi:hypothetical protein